MTLRCRLIVHVALMAAGALALAAGVLVAVSGLRQDFGVALEANNRLRHVYEVGTHVAAARRWLRDEPPNPRRAVEELQTATLKLDGLSDNAGGGGDATRGASGPGDEATGRVRALLGEAAAQVGHVLRGPETGPIDDRAEVPALDRSLAAIAQLSAETRTTIAVRQHAVDARHRWTQVAVAGLFAATVAGLIVAGAWLYRAVTAPVNRLAATARRIAAGRRDERVACAGDAEFVALARDFNGMAAQLDGLCRDLEQRVAAKSKELVRSERLASVGHLAAGVAHEINNPLGIIAGYGERALQHLRRVPASPETGDRVAKALEVMCDEAFRCKAITDRLLSLARPGTEAPAPVCLAALAREVVSTVGALGDFAGRLVTVEAGEGAGETMAVCGRDAELKQVILNLVINALQAVDPAGGRVGVSVRPAGDEWVELLVSDNGRGMSAETVDRAFEPFFSDRGRAAQRGTGLGLSITHAIVADHRGSIRAESDGVGRGSRFVVRLPAAAADAAKPAEEVEVARA